MIKILVLLDGALKTELETLALQLFEISFDRLMIISRPKDRVTETYQFSGGRGYSSKPSRPPLKGFLTGNPGNDLRLLLVELGAKGKIFMGEVENFDDPLYKNSGAGSPLLQWFRYNQEWKNPDKVLSNREIPPQAMEALEK